MWQGRKASVLNIPFFWQIMCNIVKHFYDLFCMHAHHNSVKETTSSLFCKSSKTKANSKLAFSVLVFSPVCPELSISDKNFNFSSSLLKSYIGEEWSTLILQKFFFLLLQLIIDSRGNPLSGPLSALTELLWTQMTSRGGRETGKKRGRGRKWERQRKQMSKNVCTSI